MFDTIVITKGGWISPQTSGVSLIGTWRTRGSPCADRRMCRDLLLNFNVIGLHLVSVINSKYML